MVPDDVTYFCEPFVGGGGLTIPLIDRLPPGSRVYLNDVDPRVAAWWAVMADRDSDHFSQLMWLLKIVTPTVESFFTIQKMGLDPHAHLPFRAFSGIFINRCSFSGALGAGPIGGREQLSRYTVDCRYNLPKLIQRHEEIRELLLRHEVVVTSEDFRMVMERHSEAFMYVDPPYRGRANNVYPTAFDDNDHEALAALLMGRSAPWLLSHTDQPWLHERYEGCDFSVLKTYYTAASQRQERIVGHEVVVSRGIGTELA